MAKKKAYEVDEDYLKTVMAGDIPALKRKEKEQPEEVEEPEAESEAPVKKKHRSESLPIPALGRNGRERVMRRCFSDEGSRYSAGRRILA